MLLLLWGLRTVRANRGARSSVAPQGIKTRRAPGETSFKNSTCVLQGLRGWAGEQVSKQVLPEVARLIQRARQQKAADGQAGAAARPAAVGGAQENGSRPQV